MLECGYGSITCVVISYVMLYEINWGELTRLGTRMMIRISVPVLVHVQEGCTDECVVAVVALRSGDFKIPFLFFVSPFSWTSSISAFFGVAFNSRIGCPSG